MFHIPHQPTRHWIIQRDIWHIDDCLLFVLSWIPEESFKIPEVSILPVWVASGLGKPILTHKPRLDPSNMGQTKVLVEMELERDFPKLIALDDKQGHIYLVKVEYTWIPSTQFVRDVAAYFIKRRGVFCLQNLKILLVLHKIQWCECALCSLSTGAERKLT